MDKKPTIGNCTLVCNQQDVMPLMQWYIEEEGMGVRQAARKVEADFFEKYGKDSPVTEARARNVWSRRKGGVSNETANLEDFRRKYGAELHQLMVNHITHTLSQLQKSPYCADCIRGYYKPTFIGAED